MWFADKMTFYNNTDTTDPRSDISAGSVGPF